MAQASTVYIGGLRCVSGKVSLV